VSPTLVLVGPPGAGKSTVGRVLAERLGVEFRDTDDDVERVAGMPVSDIFDEQGEPAFRALERTAVAAALAEHDGVLAVGGGSIVDEATRSALDGLDVVFLDVGVGDAAKRVGLARDRPLLLGNPRAQWLRLMEARRPLYEQVSTLTVTTDGQTPEQVADIVLTELSSRA
jgi:shikimate kinase